MARRGRAAPGERGAGREPALRGALPGRGGGRPPPQPGLQRGEPRRDLQDPGDHQPGAADEHRPLLPSPRARAGEPRGGDRSARRPAPPRRKALHRGPLPAERPRRRGARGARSGALRGLDQLAPASRALRDRAPRGAARARNRSHARAPRGGREPERPHGAAGHLAPQAPRGHVQRARAGARPRMAGDPLRDDAGRLPQPPVRPGARLPPEPGGARGSRRAGALRALRDPGADRPEAPPRARHDLHHLHSPARQPGIDPHPFARPVRGSRHPPPTSSPIPSTGGSSSTACGGSGRSSERARWTTSGTSR